MVQISESWDGYPEIPDPDPEFLEGGSQSTQHQAPIEEATLHQNESNFWRPKKSILLSSFDKLALFISITILTVKYFCQILFEWKHEFKLHILSSKREPMSFRLFM